MLTSYIVKDGEKKGNLEEIAPKQMPIPTPEKLKFSGYNIREKIMDSLNSLKYGYVLIMLFSFSCLILGI